jgi:hypothetical protein
MDFFIAAAAAVVSVVEVTLLIIQVTFLSEMKIQYCMFRPGEIYRRLLNLAS